MSYELEKTITFEAAHRLPHHDGKCSRLHGHSWKATIIVKGHTLRRGGAKDGMLMDYGEMKAPLNELVEDYLDHHFLNDTLDLESPTSEQIARWIYEQLADRNVRGLYAVRVEETCTSKCTFCPSD